MGLGDEETAGSLVDILKEDMTNGFVDKLCKRDKRISLVIFKVKIFHDYL